MSARIALLLFFGGGSIPKIFTQWISVSFFEHGLVLKVCMLGDFSLRPNDDAHKKIIIL